MEVINHGSQPVIIKKAIAVFGRGTMILFFEGFDEMAVGTIMQITADPICRKIGIFQ